jgi:hypothetical protein
VVKNKNVKYIFLSMCDVNFFWHSLHWVWCCYDNCFTCFVRFRFYVIINWHFQLFWWYGISCFSFHLMLYKIRVITKLPNSEQSYKGKVKTPKYINRQNQSTTGCQIYFFINVWRKHFLAFTSLSLVLLWQLFYLFCSSIVIHTVIVTAGNIEP